MANLEVEYKRADQTQYDLNHSIQGYKNLPVISLSVTLHNQQFLFA